MENQEIFLKEYEALRAEILDRSKRENNSLFWSLTLLLALFGTGSFKIEVISVIPLAFSFFGYLWIDSSFTTYVIGSYIRTNIENRVIKSIGKLDNPLMGWENFIAKKENNFKKMGNTFLIVPILYFGLISIAAMIFQIHCLVKEPNKLVLFLLILNIAAFLAYIRHWAKLYIRLRKY